ncbi:D-amino-acid transaminase [Pseudidiomarina taiwanensis]|uniref:Aminodeoxychorismate lyase n=1 Tax=Pseudidiomarina taiwanensis TaxID=337250 RepID=A0A432ZP29_9GAMM|nr:D-amino-acid transaminase [Pseudidiomarina taiwanensis]RUO79650.1 D-amino-acid transaminase [Pseudidiomarina taiwanensis]
MNIVYLNGSWVAAEDAKVSVFDRGFLFADGIYEVVTVYSGRPFLLDEHLQRLQRSLKALHLQHALDLDYRQLIAQLIERNQVDNGLVYIQVTRGAEAQRSHLPQTEMTTPTIFATVSPLTPHWDTPEPVRVCLLEDIRWLRCDIKSISLLGNIMLKQEAANRGGAEAILHRNGSITEGTSANYFAVRDGKLWTAPADHLILPGITRIWTIELARQCGIEVIEQAFTVNDLDTLDELFLTSSSREIQPVAQIDDKIIAAGRVGPITQRLIEAFHDSKRRHLEQ